MTSPTLMEERRERIAKSRRPAFVCICGEHAFAAATRGHVVFTDAADVEVLRAASWRVYARKRYPHIIRVIGHWKGRNRTLAQVILPCAPLADHRDRDPTNNRRANLRPATHAQNAQNRRFVTVGGRFKGVSLLRGRHRAAIWLNGRNRYLGVYDVPEDAARAYDAAAREHFGEFAFLNFPEAHQ